MNRRSFWSGASALAMSRASVFPTLFVISGSTSPVVAEVWPVPILSDFEKWALLLTKLRLLQLDADQQMDWVLWGMGVPSIVDKGVPATPLPGAQDDDTLLRRSQAILKAAQEIEVPAYEAPLPGDGNVDSDDWDAMRDELSARVNFVSDATVELVERIEGREWMRAEVRQLARLSEQLYKLSEVFGDASTKFPNYEWMKAWVIPQVSILSYYLPPINDAQTIMEAKLRVLELGMAARNAEIVAITQQVRNRLLIEGAALSVKAEELNRRKAELDARKDVLDQEEERIRRRQVELDAIELDIVEIEARLNEMSREARQLQDSNRNLRASIDHERARISYQLYTRKCPLNATRYTCERADHKSWRDDVDRQVQIANNSIASYQREIFRNDGRFQQIEAERRNAEALLQVQREERVELAAEISRRRDAWQLATDELAQAVQAFFEEAWKWRATTHWEANRNDLQRLDRFLQWIAR